VNTAIPAIATVRREFMFSLLLLELQLHSCVIALFSSFQTFFH